MTDRQPQPLRLGAILRARCPSCQKGKVWEGFLRTKRRCEECGYDFNPEPGFYLGAMMMGFLTNTILTVPPMIFLKVMDVDIGLLLAFPFIEFATVGVTLIIYSRIVWLHLEYRISRRLDGTKASSSR